MRSTKSRFRILAAPSVLSVMGVGLGVGSSVEAQIEFAFPLDYPTLNDVIGITVTDLDGDALDDIAIITRFGDMTIFLNEGDGVLGFGQTFFSDADSGRAIASGDIDGDRDNDLVWVNDRGVYAFLNDGSGVAGEVVLVTTESEGALVALGDLDKDGDLEIVVATKSGGVLTFEHLDDGQFQLVNQSAVPHQYVEELRLGDVDGDGDLDIVVLDTEHGFDYYYRYKITASDLSVFINDGSGKIEETRPTPLPYEGSSNYQNPRTFALADFDNDGDLEVVLVVNDRKRVKFTFLGLMENDGNGFFQDPNIEFELDKASSFDMTSDAIDADGDGDIDLLLGNGSTLQLALLENLGGRFELQKYAGPRSASALAHGDLNGDGHWDVVTAGASTLMLWENITPWLGPRLEGEPFILGEATTLTLHGLDPDERATFLYSMNGASPTRGFDILGGLTLDLTGPIRILGSRRADAGGVAEFTFTVPAKAPLVTVSTQAVVRRGGGGEDSVKSNFLRTMVQKR